MATWIRKEPWLCGALGDPKDVRANRDALDAEQFFDLDRHFGANMSVPVLETPECGFSDAELHSQFSTGKAMNGPITSEGMGFFHNDTYGIVKQFPMSIPNVSDSQDAIPYHVWMEKDAWKTWGPRFKALAKEHGETLATVAEKMGLAESTLRSWTNGTHDVNLADVMEMCAKADVNPALVLFNAPLMKPEIKSQLRDLAKNVFDADHSIVPVYRKQAKPPRPKPRQRA